MNLRLPALGLLLASAVLAAPAPHKPARPAARSPHAAPSAPAAPARLRGVNYINGVPDTGQFLPDTTLLVQVGPRRTTAVEFVRLYFDAYPEDRPGMDSLGLVKFMDSIVDHDVMGLAAEEINKPLDFTARATMRETEQRVLANETFQRLVMDSVKVTDDDVKAVLDAMKYEGRFRHILVTDRTLAEAVRAQLISGRIGWLAAVKKYSTATTDEGPDGDIGWQPHDKLPPELDIPLYQLKPGQISQVVADRAGFHVVQMTDRRLTNKVSPEVFRHMTRNWLQSFYAGQRAEGLKSGVRARIGLVYDSTMVRMVAAKMGAAVGMQSEGFQTTIELSAVVPEFSPEDTAKALATWHGGRLSVGELVHAYTDITPLTRPNINYPEALINFIDGMVMEPWHAQMARDLGFDRDSAVVAQLHSRRERILVEAMYGDSVESKVRVTTDDRRAYYEKHKSDFFTYASVDFAAIVRHSRAGADSLLKALKAGAKPQDVLRADSLRGEVTGSIQHRRKDAVGPYHKVLFEELRPGDATVAGPDKLGDFLVLQSLAFDPGRQLSFAESEGMADESLQNIRADELLKAMLARLRPRYPIHTRPDLVMKLRMMDDRLR